MNVPSSESQTTESVLYDNGRINFRRVLVAVPLTILLIVVLSWLWVESGKAQESARKTQCNGHIFEVVYAFASYHEAFGKYPENICDEDGRALLSWRVELLRVTEFGHLFQRFVLTEPWDSESNARLLNEMPSFYSCPTDPEAKKGSFTSYCLIGGAATRGLGGLDPNANGSDIVVGECAGSIIPWTKPSDEVAFVKSLTIELPNVPRISSHHPDGAYVARLNGGREFVQRNYQ